MAITVLSMVGGFTRKVETRFIAGTPSKVRFRLVSVDFGA